MTLISRPYFGSVGTRRSVVWGALALALLCPLVAMRFTDEVRWDRADFLAGGALLFAFGVAVESAFLLLHRRLSRAAAIGMSWVTLVLIWAHAAVGVF